MRSLLLIGLFTGLIYMILPARKGSEWIGLVLAAVLILSLIGTVRSGADALSAMTFAVSDQTVPEADGYREAFAWQTANLLQAETGYRPLCVESDLTYDRKNGTFFLTEITVTCDEAVDGEVMERALQKLFAGGAVEFRVVRSG